MEAITGTKVLALKGGDDCSMFDDHAADDSPVKKVRSEFVIVNLTIVTNLMMHDFDGQYLHMDFYRRRNMVTECLRMELMIGPDVFVGELHDVCKAFAEGRQVHSNLESRDGGNSLVRKVTVKFVIVMLTIVTDPMKHDFVGLCSIQGLIHPGYRSILLESDNSARMSALVG